ncbi:tyrosine-type recombinase/integrase [Larsenimonas suaedae]|uniref:Tyrosine-type recombinase/integrase n=1 Tax=Larsenimonas suaedae TaxID=1851019 RepID=A0ABU1GYC4_9GAMM|nr:site-specific integrase [Larsenimonas suaedae]MCM2972904.1 tyrosine-type recombinase/integrase [Larsenimonas suaedae]MDR5897003.1 tyrosine-type recombinase/integrase [Larsenimonas suaedae]
MTEITGKRKAITTSKGVENFSVPAGKKKARLTVSNSGYGGLALEARIEREAKRWIYRYRDADKTVEQQLGSYPQMGLAEARKAHREAAELLRQGIDPRKHRKAEKARNQTAWTMDDAFERWIEFYASAPARSGKAPTARTVAKQRGRWRLYLKEPLGGAYVRDMTRRYLIEVLEKVSTRTREEGRQCLTLLRQLLDYCEDREQIQDNPAAGLKPAKIKARPGKPRERHLNLAEIKVLWESINEKQRVVEGVASSVVLSSSVANAIKLLMLTGARRAEVASMQWSEVKKETWTIPAERTKSGREHRIHLSALARSILTEQRRFSSSEFVFESNRSPGRPIHYDTVTSAVAKLQGRNRKEHDPSAPLYHLDHFTVHDLRRSVATMWTETFMADPLLVDAMLAHAPPKLLGTYNKSKRYQMQADVWERWGQAVSEAAEAEPQGNIVFLGAR